MLTAALIMAAVPPTDVHAARVPSLNQMQAAIIARGRGGDAGTRLRVSDERCSPTSVSRRDRQERRAVAAARCTFRYGAVAVADPAARSALWRRQHAFFYLTGSPCEGENRGSDLTCYSWTVDRELIVSAAEAL
jgi:hypothetical protein